MPLNPAQETRIAKVFHTDSIKNTFLCFELCLPFVFSAAADLRLSMDPAKLPDYRDSKFNSCTAPKQVQALELIDTIQL